MAVLGKRKAPDLSISDHDAHAIFRRHFETRFNPLPAPPSRSDDDDDDDDNHAEEDDEQDDEQDDEEQDLSDHDSDQDSEWGGLSNSAGDSQDEHDAVIQVVDHSVSQAPKPTSMSKRELKAFMSSRPPDQLATASPSTAPPPRASSSTTLPEDAPSLLAQDLELRRLLAESHLFARSSSSAAASSEPKAFAAGRIRQRTTDMRIQALGSRASILTQDKMPMHMRKGIAAAATQREARRRREAKENGIILEREAAAGGAAKKRSGQRRSGLDVARPGVGRMKGATLRISESDVKRIEGARDTFGRRGRR